MLKKTITYTDYNDVERTEEFHFNLSRAEVVEMQMTAAGGMGAMMKRIVASNDTREIMEMFKIILSKAYGVKSDDGRQFVKSKEISDSFLQSEAYSEFLMELIGDAKMAAVFVNGIIPKDMIAEVMAEADGADIDASAGA